MDLSLPFLCNVEYIDLLCLAIIYLMIQSGVYDSVKIIC